MMTDTKLQFEMQTGDKMHARTKGRGGVYLLQYLGHNSTDEYTKYNFTSELDDHDHYSLYVRSPDDAMLVSEDGLTREQVCAVNNTPHNLATNIYDNSPEEIYNSFEYEWWNIDVCGYDHSWQSRALTTRMLERLDEDGTTPEQVSEFIEAVIINIDEVADLDIAHLYDVWEKLSWKGRVTGEMTESEAVIYEVVKNELSERYTEFRNGDDSRWFDANE